MGGGGHYLSYLHLPESQLKLFPWTSSLNDNIQNRCGNTSKMLWGMRNEHSGQLSQNHSGAKKNKTQSVITFFLFLVLFQTFVRHIFCDDGHLSSPWSKPLVLGNDCRQWYDSIIMKVLCIMKVLKDVTNARWKAPRVLTGMLGDDISVRRSLLCLQRLESTHPDSMTALYTQATGNSPHSNLHALLIRRWHDLLRTKQCLKQ